MKARIICPVLLVLLIAGHLSVNLVWESQDIGPDTWDPASYLTLSERMYAEYRHGGVGAFGKAFMRYDRNRAPLVPALYMVSYMALGNNRSSAHWINHVALVVLCLSLYGVGRRLAGPWCGVAAAWITMSFPMIFGLSRRLYVEMPLMAAVAVVVYLCIVSDGMRRLGICVLMGIVIGVGLLIKITFPLFVFGPMLAVFLVGVFYSGKSTRSRNITPLINLPIVLFIASLIAGPWLVYNFNSWSQYMRVNVGGHLGQMFTDSIPGYLAAQSGVSFLPIYLFIAAVLLMLKLLFRGGNPDTQTQMPGDVRRRQIILIAVALWLVIPFAVGLFSLNKDARMLSPMLPALGLLLSYLYVRLVTPRTRPVAVVLLLLMVVPFYGLSFLTSGYVGQYENEDAHANPICFRTLAGGAPYAPNREDWKGEDIVSAIEAAIPTEFIKNDKMAAVTVVTNHPCFQSNWFSYLEWRRVVERGQHRISVGYRGVNYLDKDVSLEKCGMALLDVHFILAKDSGPQGPAEWFDRMMNAVRRSDLFERVDCNITLPDGSRVIIFRQKGITGEAAPHERERLIELRKKFREFFIGDES